MRDEMFYDRQGEPITMDQLVTLSSIPEYIRVALTQVGHYRVSTVWLGVSINTVGLPLIFETMIFANSIDDIHDLEMRRYTTEAEALAGHETMCEELEEWIK